MLTPVIIDVCARFWSISVSSMDNQAYYISQTHGTARFEHVQVKVTGKGQTKSEMFGGII